MKIKIIISGMLFIGMLTFSSCFEFEFDIPVTSTGGGGGWWDPNITEESLVQPGWLSADSAVYVGQDSIKLFGHFSSFVTINRKVIIDGIYFIMTSSWGDDVRDTVAQNVVWNLHNNDTTISFVTIVPAMDVPTNVYFSMHMMVTNNLPEPHQQEKYWYSSYSTTIQYFAHATLATQDSVTFMGTDKAILWAHLETEMDCEILYAGFEWNERGYSPAYDTIPTPQYLSKGMVIHVRDTVNIKPNTLYDWRFFAYLKYGEDSVGIVKGFKNTFRKDGN